LESRGPPFYLVVTPYDEFKQVVPQHFKDHAHVGPVDAADFEIVQELDTPLSEGVRAVALADTLEQLDLVQGRLCVVGRTLHHLQGHKLFVRQIPAQPDGRKVAPAELAHNVVAVVKQVANFDRVVTTFCVIFGILLQR
jgi:hypothetical protein